MYTFACLVEKAEGPAIRAAEGEGVPVEGLLDGLEGGDELLGPGEGGENGEDGGEEGLRVLEEEFVGVGGEDLGARGEPRKGGDVSGWEVGQGGEGFCAEIRGNANI